MKNFCAILSIMILCVLRLISKQKIKKKYKTNKKTTTNVNLNTCIFNVSSLVFLSLCICTVYTCLFLCRSISIDFFDLPTLCSEHPIEIVLPKHTHTDTLTTDHQQYYNNQRERELEPSLCVYMCLKACFLFSVAYSSCVT